MKKIKMNLYKLHPGQQAIEDGLKRYNVVTMGRRFGKSSYLIWKAVHAMLKGQYVGLWIPSYSDYFPSYWRDLESLIPKALIRKANKNERIISLVTGGFIRIYSTEKDDAGRGEKFHLALIDEAGLHKKLKEYWEAVIRPTLVDFEGSAIFAGTPKGKNFFYDLSLKHLSDLNWSFFTAPSFTNPFLPKSERDDMMAMNSDDPFERQEYFAEFLDSGGDLFGPLSFVTEPQEAEYYKIGIDLAKAQDYTVVAVFNDKNEMIEMERWNTMSWDNIVEKIKSIIQKYPESIVVMDKTGVGSPIIDYLEKDNYTVQHFTFTEGSRNGLLEKLSLYIADQRIFFQDDELIVKEFEAFQRYYKNGKVKLLSHIHDDIVMACGLALQAEEPKYAKCLWD